MPTPQRDTRQHRLTDIEVEEVSNVDRAANKKRFLLIKRDGDEMATKELRSDGRGGFTRVRKAADEEEDEEKAKKADEEEEEDEEKAKKPPPFGGNKAPPFGKKPPPFGKKPKDDDEEEDEEKAKKADEEEDEEDEAEKAEKAASVRKDMLAEVTGCIEALMGIAEDLKEGEGEPEAEIQQRLVKAHGKLGKACETFAKKSLEKAGRRMSKERLDRFKSALEALSSILKEVMSSPELPDDPKGKTEKRAGGESVEDRVEKLERLVKRQARELEAYERGSGSSNAVPVEKSGGARGRSDDDVEWPLDMNRPITRGTTARETSFYGDE